MGEMPVTNVTHLHLTGNGTERDSIKNETKKKNIPIVKLKSSMKTTTLQNVKQI